MSTSSKERIDQNKAKVAEATGDRRSIRGAKRVFPRKPTTVAGFLDKHIERSGLPMRAIADACGFNKDNVISMIRSGNTKMPLSRIPAMAKIIDVDPVFLFKMAVNEYEPELAATLEEIFGQTPLTANEKALIELVRKGPVADPAFPEDRAAELFQLIDSLNPGA